MMFYERWVGNATTQPGEAVCVMTSDSILHPEAELDEKKIRKHNDMYFVHKSAPAAFQAFEDLEVF